MAATKRPTTFSMRMPEDLNEKIQAYATKNNCTKAEAMSHFARAGIELEESGAPAPAGGVPPEVLRKLDERLEALQNLPKIEPEPTTAIVPADLRDKIQAYSAAHDCSEQEALTYYARIGVQMTDEQRPANATDMAELYRRLDVLAQDSQNKSEQLQLMSDAINTIREYTKPDEVELEGELAEDVEEHELTEEERQQIADEHTRKIVSDVMGDYFVKQQEAQAQAQAAEREKTSRPSMNIWIPILIAVIISLLVGLVVVLLTR